jgi:hypothetical protein
VFAGVSAGLIVAGGMIATGFKLPTPREAGARDDIGAVQAEAAAPPEQSRAGRVAAAAALSDRRDAVTYATAGLGRRRRVAARPSPAPSPGESASRAATVAPPSSTTAIGAARAGGRAAETRLGQGPRRNAGPRAMRAGVRSAS